MKWLLLVATLLASRIGAEEWRKVAFIGSADVKSISGLVEVMNRPGDQILRAGDVALPGQTLKIWRGAEVILMMKNSKSLVRAKGPVLLRLAPESEAYDRASLTGEEPAKGFVVRAVRGHGKYQDGPYWRAIQAGMTLPEGALVRPFRDSILDFYHPATRTTLRVTDHTKRTALATVNTVSGGSGTTLAARAP